MKFLQKLIYKACREKSAALQEYMFSLIKIKIWHPRIHDSTISWNLPYDILLSCLHSYPGLETNEKGDRFIGIIYIKRRHTESRKKKKKANTVSSYFMPVERYKEDV